MIAIRFDGPPAPESGRFVEVERDGAGINFGEWKQDGEFWLLELTGVDKLEKAIEEARCILYDIPEDAPENWNHVNASIQEAHDILEAAKVE